MTTIAARDGILAVDTNLVSTGRVYAQGRKIGRSVDGWWAAGCGEAALVEAFLGWMAKRKLGRPNRLRPWIGLPEQGWDKTGMVLLDPKGGMWFYEGHGRPVPVRGDFVADGSGGGIAVGAMAMGASAIEAVQVAIRFDSSTGGDVEYVSAGGGAVLIAPALMLPGKGHS